MAKILVVDDDVLIRRLIIEVLEDRHTVEDVESGEEALQLLDRANFNLVILDLKMPGLDGHQVLKLIKKFHPSIQTIMLSGFGDSCDAVKAIKEGAFWYLDKPFNPLELSALIDQALSHHELNSQNAILKSNLEVLRSSFNFSSRSESFVSLERKIEKIRDLDEPILLTGETGTGKSTLARLVHDQSKRSDKPFVTISCAALPKDLIEAEIFGHEKGAFTGAVSSRIGGVEAANGGTLFLDEIGDLPIELQPKLLVLLQEKIVKKLGSNTEKKVDVRIITATHKNLNTMCHNGQFRSDLFFRLNVFCIEVPPLRDRLEDVQSFINNFLANIAEKRSVEKYALTEQARQKLLCHSWPGNIRELNNVLERAFAFAEDHVIGEGDIEIIQINNNFSDDFENKTLAEIELQVIQKTLGRFKGNKKEAAELLGISEKTIYNRLKKVEYEHTS